VARRRANNPRPAFDLAQFGEDQPRSGRAHEQRRADDRDGGERGNREQQRDGKGEHRTNPFECRTTGESRQMFPLIAMFSICSVMSTPVWVVVVSRCVELALDFPVRYG